MFKSKDQAFQFLKSVISTTNSLVKAQAEFQEKLNEIKQLEKDHFIGLQLTKNQLELLESKKGYELMVVFLNDLISKNTLKEVENVDEAIKLSVECIFLEKKEAPAPKEEVKPVEKEHVVQKEVKVVKKEVPSMVHDDKDDEILDTISTYQHVRIPYAWKNGVVSEGGQRQRKREVGKMKKEPAKEYRGWNVNKNID